MKADRIPHRVQRRLSDAERRAVDELRFCGPDAARRGELKTALGWKRTREETLSYANVLMRGGMALTGVAARLKVDKRYLSRLIAGGEPRTDSVPRKPSADAVSGATNVQTLTRTSPCSELPAPASGFRSFAELDGWLEERGR